MSNQNPKKAPAALGLRERKKQQTRLAISDVATRLFIERGFENVTIAEVAAAADVSVNTVFNYFSTKEELFFDRGPALIETSSQIVRDRHRGESAVAALRRSFRKAIKSEIPYPFGRRLKPFLSTIEASPALKARGSLMLDESEEHLVATLIEETGSSPEDPTARAVAAMITGVESLLLQELRRQILAGTPDDQLRVHLSKLGERSFDLLITAAGDYCIGH